MILVVGGAKGGIGKSTIAANMAAMRSAAGYSVMLIDTDNVMANYAWALTREQEQPDLPPVAFTHAPDDSFRSDIEDLKEQYDDIVIDIGAGVHEGLRAGLCYADCHLVPIQHCHYTANANVLLYETIDGAKKFNHKLKTFWIVNHVRLKADRKRLINTLDQTDYPILGILQPRAAFNRSVGHGMAVTEYTPKDSAAIEEITTIYKGVYDGR